MGDLVERYVAENLPQKQKSADFYRLLPPNQKNRLTAIDLFSGAGGISLGLSNAGFNVLFASDIDSFCGQTHESNLPGTHFHCGDITELTPKQIFESTKLKRGELDLLMGGPPCQGFSIIGARLVDDPRNKLFLQYMRIAEDLKPKVLVIENVPGLSTLGGGNILRAISESFDRAGYSFECGELLAAHYGVPQMRWRMFMIGVRKDLKEPPSLLPDRSHGTRTTAELRPNKSFPASYLDGFLTAGEAIKDLPKISSGELLETYSGKPETPYQVAMRAGLGTELYNHYAPKLSEANIARIKFLKPGQDWRDLPHELLPDSMKRALRKDHTRRFRRMTWNGVPRSIITRFRDPKSGEYSHPSQARTISIREAARIQSFPDWFKFHGPNTAQYDQVGNAVPPLLARAIGQQVCAFLSGQIELSAKRKRGLAFQSSLFDNRIQE